MNKSSKKYPFLENIKSTAIKGLYIANKYDILVQFVRGEYYLFYDAAYLFHEWSKAKSKGKYFHAKIKNKFKYSRVIMDT